jgi:ACS family glucarate transporter-like MFS transporter/ACS family D-galactonate transporter-like MFS transporter
MNMCGNLGAAFCPIIVERIANVTGNWNIVLVFFAFIYLAAAFCWCLVNPNGTILDPTPDEELISR